jgi:hypothetical protein
MDLHRLHRRGRMPGGCSAVRLRRVRPGEGLEGAVVTPIEPKDAAAMINAGWLLAQDGDEWRWCYSHPDGRAVTISHEKALEHLRDGKTPPPF